MTDEMIHNALEAVLPGTTIMKSLSNMVGDTLIDDVVTIEVAS